MRKFYLQGTLVLAILCAFPYISPAQDFSNKGVSGYADMLLVSILVS